MKKIVHLRIDKAQQLCQQLSFEFTNLKNKITGHTRLVANWDIRRFQRTSKTNGTGLPADYTYI